MSTHIPSSKYPKKIHWKRYARNGLPVCAPFMKAASEAINHCIAYRGQKCVLMYSRDLNAMHAGSAGSLSLWRCFFRAGYGTEKLRAVVGMLPVTDPAAVDPVVFMDVTISGGAKVSSDELHFASVPVSTQDVPDSFYFGQIQPFALTPNTAYEVLVIAKDYARPFSIMIWTEAGIPVDDADTGVVDPSYSVSMPITDAQHADLLVACNNLWDRNGAQLFAWTTDGAAVSPTFATTTYTNVLDTTSTGSAGTSTPGFQLQTRYKARQAVSTVPVVLAVHGERTVGAGTGKARLVNTSGTAYEVTGITTAGWYTTAASIAASDDLKLDLQAAVSAAGTTVRIDAASLYQER